MMASPRTWVWWFNLLLLAAVGYATGLTSAQVLRMELERNTPPPRLQTGPAERVAPRHALVLSAFQPILDDNIFKAQRSAQAPTALAQATPGGQAAMPAAPGPLKLTLTGTVIVGRVGYAFVVGPDGRSEEVYKVGQCLPAGDDHPTRQCQPNQGKLVSVRKSRIRVRYRDQVLSFELNMEERSNGHIVRGRAAMLRQPVRKPPPRPSGAGMFPSTRNGNTIDMRVPNAEVEKAFDNFADILKQARVVPYTGKDVQGFQIRAIQPGSIFQRIGLHNYDIIRSVNGEAITTADQAMRLLTIFRNEKQVVLDVRRRNEDLKLSYMIE